MVLVVFWRSLTSSTWEVLRVKDFGGVGVERGHWVGDFQEGEVKPGTGRVAGKSQILTAAWKSAAAPISPVETPEILWKRRTQQLVGSA